MLTFLPVLIETQILMFLIQRDPILNIIPVQIERQYIMFLIQWDPILIFIPVQIERHSYYVFYTVRPNFKFHSGPDWDTDSYVFIQRDPILNFIPVIF